MEALLEAVGWVTFTLLVIVGLLAGWIASLLAGGRRARYMVVGVIGAVATPFILAALGIGVLAAGGLLLLLAVALIGALLVLVLTRMIASKRNK